MESLQCLCMKVELRTNTETSMMHGALTDLREAVAFLRKLADEIAIELRSEPSRTSIPSREPAPAPPERARACDLPHRDCRWPSSPRVPSLSCCHMCQRA